MTDRKRPKNSETPETDDVATAHEVVTVGKVPGPMRDIPFEKGLTVGKVLARAEIRLLNQCTLERNGSPCGMSDEVEAGDQVLAILNIEGNKAE